MAHRVLTSGVILSMVILFFGIGMTKLSAANGASLIASPAGSPLASPQASPIGSPLATVDLLATVQAQQSVEAASGAETATALTTQNAQLQAALVGMATSEAAAKQSAADSQEALVTAHAEASEAMETAQSQLDANQATVAAQATEFAVLELTATANVIPTSTPTSTPTPMPTSTETLTPSPTPTDTPEPTPTPTPKRGEVVYRATTKEGLDDWNGSSSWKHLNGMLVNDGSEYPSNIIAPYGPLNFADYAVEAQIQFIRGGSGCSFFGIFVRATDTGGYSGTVWPDCDPLAEIETLEQTSSHGYGLAQVEFDPGNDWHTYRIEVEGNAIRFLVDRTILTETTDNQFLDGGRIGLLSSGAQINVRSFKVIAL